MHYVHTLIFNVYASPLIAQTLSCKCTLGLYDYAQRAQRSTHEQTAPHVIYLQIKLDIKQVSFMYYSSICCVPLAEQRCKQ